MAAQSQHRGFALNGARCIEDGFPSILGIPSLTEMAQPSGEAFETDQLDDFEAGLFEFAPKLLWIMEKGRREPMRAIIWIAVLALGEIPLDDLPELGIEEEPSGQTIEERGKAADRRHRNQPTRHNHAQALAQSLLPVVMVRQVVHRSEHESDIDALVGHREVSCIADLCRYSSRTEIAFDSLNMTRRQVNDVNVVAAFGEPRCVNAGTTANIQYPCGRSWEVTPKDLLGSHELELAES